MKQAKLQAGPGTGQTRTSNPSFNSSIARLLRGAIATAFFKAFAWFVLMAFMTFAHSFCLGKHALQQACMQHRIDQSVLNAKCRTIVLPSRMVRTKIFEISVSDQRKAASAVSSVVIMRTASTAQETNGAKSSVGMAYPTCRRPNAEMSCTRRVL